MIFVNEEREKLFDNAILAQKNLNLSLGIALLQYVEEVVNGEKVLVPKLYLSENTLIARNGGKIDTDSLTNIGAVIGSLNEKERLKVSANKVIVKDLEDKNKYENIGGGITIGTDVPNTSIKHDKVDKEQINRATTINTDFEISGKNTSGEDLGFNTDIDKS